MDVIRLDEHTFPGALFEAVRVVKAGGVVAYPTDTVYGIGGNALDAKVAERVYRIKERPRDKGFVLLVKDHADARKYAYIDLWTEDVLEKIWPGPISVVLHKKDAISSLVSGGSDTIALRMPKARFASELLNQVSLPLIATSANRSEDSAPSNTLSGFMDYLETKNEKPDLVIDAGTLESADPSTLFDLTDRKNPAILRKGTFSKADLEAMLQRQIQLQ